MRKQMARGAKGFSLLEVLVAVAVFTLIIAAYAGTLASIQQAWQKQRNAIMLLQNARWAIEFLTNEMRQAGAPISIFAGDRLDFQPYPGPPVPRVWYWRGDTNSDTTGLGDITFLYRGIGADIFAAYSARQQLANFIVDNPSGNDIFRNLGGNLYAIELTVRPQPGLAEGMNNRNYTLRTQAKARN